MADRSLFVAQSILKKWWKTLRYSTLRLLVSRGVQAAVERVPDGVIDEVRAIIGSIFDD